MPHTLYLIPLVLIPYFFSKPPTDTTKMSKFDRVKLLKSCRPLSAPNPVPA